MSMLSRLRADRMGGPVYMVKDTIPQPGTNEVLVKIAATALNPYDWKQLYLGIMVKSWPLTFGSEASGTIAAVGNSIKDFKVGDRITARFNPAIPEQSAFATFATTTPDVITPLPDSMSFEEGASIPAGFMTATSVIYSRLKIAVPFMPSRRDAQTFKSILVVGGSSSVGSSAIQILRSVLPDLTIIATSSAKHHENLRHLGANATIDYHSPDVVSQITTASPKTQGVEAILDCVSGVAAQPELFDVLTGPKLFAELISEKDGTNIPAGVKHVPCFGRLILTLPGGDKLLLKLGGLLEEGKFRAPLPVTVITGGLEKIPEMLEITRKGVSGRKYVVKL